MPHPRRRGPHPAEAKDALTDEKVGPGLELCTTCRPQDALN
ncbi:hypothetical protein [Streptomyces iconiensis]|uniref:Uncharacterized protein n=1 Tax=Streptomyces iconiensis TaxID=1384038 RepID=A0ABT7A276_9ACTN|nr:hypothetical protein [Streptomyces iconiensis]MDJ1135419.1 hypothetical protein [Streptomyces iconiensis]